jgi:hypothetical protein
MHMVVSKRPMSTKRINLGVLVTVTYLFERLKCVDCNYWLASTLFSLKVVAQCGRRKKERMSYIESEESQITYIN